MSSEQVEETFHGKNGKIYAAYVVENPEDPFNSKPLCAALLMINPKDLRYERIKIACQSNGCGLLTNIILNSTMELTMSDLKEQFDYHYNIRLNAFRKASKIKCSPRLGNHLGLIFYWEGNQPGYTLSRNCCKVWAEQFYPFSGDN